MSKCHDSCFFPPEIIATSNTQTQHTVYYVQNGQALNNKVYSYYLQKLIKKIMETKKATKVYLNQLCALENHSIELRKLQKFSLLRKVPENQRFHRLCMSEKSQLFEWYLSENTMFQHPRRRKFYLKRAQQGQNLSRNFAKMLYFRDNLQNDGIFIMQTPQIMLKSSVVATMW